MAGIAERGNDCDTSALNRCLLEREVALVYATWIGSGRASGLTRNLPRGEGVPDCADKTEQGDP